MKKSIPVQREGPVLLHPRHTTTDQKFHSCMRPHLIATARLFGENSSTQRKEAISGLTSVAAHVHAETIPEAMRPGLTLLEALLNSSEFLGEKPVYRVWMAVKQTIKALKNKPIPARRSVPVRKIGRDKGIPTTAH